MVPALSNLQSQAVWKHFDRLAAIPRASTKEAAARKYVLSLVAKLGLESIRDDVSNLVVRKPRTAGPRRKHRWLSYRGTTTWYVKNEDTVHTFDVDYQGDKTLCSDNGIGVSAALVVMESNDIAHGPLEFLFTIDEESGLTGASAFPGGLAF